MAPQKNLFDKFDKIGFKRGTLFLLIILTALLAFEVFNYSTTDYALADLLGGLTFAGLKWSTILAIAFCGIDFAGIARLFTPDATGKETTEVWYLFGAWMLAATMNAILTWWGVSMALVNHKMMSTSVVDLATLTRAVPIFVAVMVWLIRILIIGTLSLHGDRIAGRVDQRVSSGYSTARAPAPSFQAPRPAVPSIPALRPAVPQTSASPSSGQGRAASFQPFQRSALRQEPASSRTQAQARSVEPVYTRPEPEHASPEPVFSRPEPVYQNLAAAPRQVNNGSKF